MRMGGLGRSRSRCTGPRLPVRQRRRAREASESLAGSAERIAAAYFEEFHPVSRRVCLQLVVH